VTYDARGSQTFQPRKTPHYSEEITVIHSLEIALFWGPALGSKE